MDTSQFLAADAHETEAPEVSDSIRLSTAERITFDAVYRRHRHEVMGLLLRRVGNEQDAADLMQEAYLRILRYRHFGADSLKYLLIRTAINLAASHHLAASRRMPHMSLEGLEIALDAPAMDESLDSEQRLQHTMAAAQALPSRCRQIFILRLVHGLRQREIAERCGISARMVEQHLARAQVLIRKRVGALAA